MKAGKEQGPAARRSAPKQEDVFDVVFSEQWTRADLPQPIPAFSWRGALAPHVIVATMLPLLLALTLPLDALDRWPWLREWVEMFTAQLPELIRTAKATAFPHVALAVYCSVIVSFVIVLLHFLVTALFVNYHVSLIRYRVLRFMSPAKMVIVAVLGPAVAVISLYAFLMLPGDPGFAEGLTTKSRFGLGLLSAISVWFLAFSAAGAPVIVRLLLDVHLTRVGQE